ncbi:MAG: isoprenylcysteine carboxylmethyltransferase family protein [Deltaproteobacteria bacterium]|nr:isoprenylcysteine carboxylmethyltransferase family protein [Deltaproteobacteria bacterium]
MTTEDEPTDGAAVRFPPPFVPLIALVLGGLLQHLAWPLPLPVEGALGLGMGAVLCVAALAMMAAAFGLFRRTGQDPKPWESTPEILSTGIYRFSRNPMYVAMGLLLAGIGLALGNGWMLLFVPVVWAVIYRIAIRHEEAYLEQKFGSIYLDYKASVRRWL